MKSRIIILFLLLVFLQACKKEENDVSFVVLTREPHSISIQNGVNLTGCIVSNSNVKIRNHGFLLRQDFDFSYPSSGPAPIPILLQRADRPGNFEAHFTFGPNAYVGQVYYYKAFAIPDKSLPGDTVWGNTIQFTIPQ